MANAAGTTEGRKPRTASWKVHPGIFQILGAQLVSNPVRAISELVKNAYDAGAKHALVDLAQAGAIVVQDTGKGMDYETLDGGWLQIATPLKRENLVGEDGRPVSGSMGIGRMSAFSLGGLVRVETGTSPTTWYGMTLSYQALAQAASFDEMATTIEPIEPPIGLNGRALEHGTIIRITELTIPGRSIDPDKLRVGMGILRGPSDTSDFTISIRATEEEGWKAADAEEDLPVPAIRLEGTISKEGKATYQCLGEARLYVGSGGLKHKTWLVKSSGTFSHVKNVKLHAYWFPKGERRPGEKYWETAEGINAIRDFTGVRVYRDSIRVLPYGEAGNDWLELERKYVRAGARERRVRAGQIFGWVEFTRSDNPALLDVANREGLLANEAYQEFERFASEAFDALAEYRRAIEPVVPKKKRVSATDLEEASAEVRNLRSKASADPDAQETLERVESILESAREELEVVQLYRDRITAGNLVRLIMHDVGSSLTAGEKFIKKAAAQECTRPSHKEAFEITLDLLPRMVGGYKLLKGAPRSGVFRKSNVDIEALTETVLDTFETSLSTETEFIREISPAVAKVRDADVWSILVNLLQNAVSSSAYEQGRTRDFPPERKVLVRVYNTETDLTIEIEDNGPGLPDKPEDWLWTQFNSTRKEGGSGLGLWIVAEIVSMYAGEKSAGPSETFPTGAKFRIMLPGVVSDA